MIAAALRNLRLPDVWRGESASGDARARG